MKKIIITGVKPTGVPHIGNYLGAIKPMIDLINTDEYYSYVFLADFHALNALGNANELREYTKQLACIYLACGLNPDKCCFYRQSDVPETFELASILTNVTPKGLMNRAHAYKAKVENNLASGNDADYGVNMGLFNYPILMSADILLFNANLVPVGLDQKQHIEIARDIAEYFNKKYKKTFVLPEPLIDENVPTIIGTDGQHKMSKSYGNVIPLYVEDKQLRKLVMSIVTDSTPIGEKKNTKSTVFELYSLFATNEETIKFKKRFDEGISWAEAKETLYQKLSIVLGEIREKYNYFFNNYNLVEEILQKGAQKAREFAKHNIEKVRKTIGI